MHNLKPKHPICNTYQCTENRNYTMSTLNSTHSDPGNVQGISTVSNTPLDLLGNNRCRALFFYYPSRIARKSMSIELKG